MAVAELWSIREFSEIYLDALVRNEAGQLMFASLYGRDTAVQQLLAAFSLPLTQGGVDRITLNPVEAPPQAGDGIPGVASLHASRQPEDSGGFAFVGDAARLAKLAGKLPKRSLFGPVSHVFIYDPQVNQPDTANGRAWVLSHGDERGTHRSSVWTMIRRVSPVPLIDAWHEPLLTHLGGAIVRDLDRRAGFAWPTLGPVQASIVDLGETFSEDVSSLVKGRVLRRRPETDDTIRRELPLAA